MKNRQVTSSLLVTVVFHSIVLGGMALIKMTLPAEDTKFAIDTVMAPEERTQEEIQQKLDEQKIAATSMNTIAGGQSVSAKVGGSGKPLMSKQKMEEVPTLTDPTVRVNVSDNAVMSQSMIGDDLGEEQVTGEVGALVEGYGAALDRLSQELIRMMRSDKLLVVWLFDESESMKDDQKEIKQRLHRVYEELKLVEKEDSKPGETGSSKRKNIKLAETLKTAVTSFGKDFHVHLRTPSSDVKQIMQAIDKIPLDKTGAENTCAAMIAAMNLYKSHRSGSERRKLVFVLVSDESGDDGEHIEAVIKQARTLKAPFYILGREAVFGSLYAHVRWVQPMTGRVYKLPIRRGPETPYAEQMQFDGFRRRYDSHMSAFGPYEQVRLARDTGGIFFQLPHEEENINDFDNKKYEAYNLREYLPNLTSRRDYALERDKSKFRKAVWDVIVATNPYNPANKGLEIPEEEYFPINSSDYLPRIRTRIVQILNILTVLNTAQRHLEQVRPLRDREPSVRWRANYDLIYAQLYAYRLRLFQYALGLDQYGKTMHLRKLKNPKTNHWSIGVGGSEIQLPDAAQSKALKITPDDVKEAHAQSLKLLADVAKAHPRTPWAKRAEWELGRQFGVHFVEHYFAPPNPNAPRPPPAPPPPNL